MPISFLPPGFTTVTPFLMVKDVRKAAEYLTAAFAAELTQKLEMPDGSYLHAQLAIHGAKVMIGPTMGHDDFGSAMVCLYVPDADAAFTAAIAAGGKSMSPVADQPWGDRAGGVTDPSGTVWWISTRREILSQSELRARMVPQAKA